MAASVLKLLTCLLLPVPPYKNTGPPPPPPPPPPPLCVPASELNTPHIWRPWAPGPVSLRSHRSGLAVCSWPVSPECCCHLSDPPESRPAGRASAGSGAWSPAPTVKKHSQQRSEEVLEQTPDQLKVTLQSTSSVRFHLTVVYIFQQYLNKSSQIQILDIECRVEESFHHDVYFKSDWESFSIESLCSSSIKFYLFHCWLICKLFSLQINLLLVYYILENGSQSFRWSKHVQFTVIEEERNQEMFTFKRLESENFDFYFPKKTLKLIRQL